MDNYFLILMLNTLQIAVSLYLATAFGRNSQNNEYNSIIELLQFVVVLDFLFKSFLLQKHEFFEGMDYSYSFFYLQSQE